MKPNVRVPGHGTRPLKEAYDLTTGAIGLTESDYQLIDDQVWAPLYPLYNIRLMIYTDREDTIWKSCGIS